MSKWFDILDWKSKPHFRIYLIEKLKHELISYLRLNFEWGFLLRCLLWFWVSLSLFELVLGQLYFELVLIFVFALNLLCLQFERVWLAFVFHFSVLKRSCDLKLTLWTKKRILELKFVLARFSSSNLVFGTELAF